ncbi:hypothetical protein ACFVYA_06255 [Amycolatopsis sp. NPDC058278]|uniref:hypothetical protein n=1 Tax=Amycolatopsis sp. NPDC058278 TaxID=3346417 RepID=UPI0036DDFEB4
MATDATGAAIAPEISTVVSPIERAARNRISPHASESLGRPGAKISARYKSYTGRIRPVNRHLHYGRYHNTVSRSDVLVCRCHAGLAMHPARAGRGDLSQLRRRWGNRRGRASALLHRTSFVVAAIAVKDDSLAGPQWTAQTDRITNISLSGKRIGTLRDGSVLIEEGGGLNGYGLPPRQR